MSNMLNLKLTPFFPVKSQCLGQDKAVLNNLTEYCKNKTKVIKMTNHKRCRRFNGPITTQ